MWLDEHGPVKVAGYRPIERGESLWKGRTLREDSGFTLIELILVVLILAILAGIAIPVFLRQREKGWNAQVQSTLRNAATAQESFANDNDHTYATTVEELTDEGLRFGATEVTFVDAGIIATGPTS